MFGPEEESEDSGLAWFAAIVACVLMVFSMSACSSEVNNRTRLEKGLADLTLRYETLQCSTRGLDLTTVKGITLCMDRQSRALHKIDEKAD